MKSMRFLKMAAITLASLGLVVPRGTVMAAGQDAIPTKQTADVKQTTVDVELGADGLLVGHVVDENGAPVEGAIVSIRHGRNEVANTQTDKNGVFHATSLRGGVHQIVAGNGSGLYRFWTNDAAPPKSQDQAVVVSGSEVVRGQCNCGGLDVITLTTLGASIAAAVLAGITLDKVNDVEDQVDQLQPASP